MRAIPILFLVLILVSCNYSEQPKVTPSELQSPLKTGVWRLSLDINNQELPVNLFVRNEGGLKVDFINNTEVITAYEYMSEGDSLHVRMPLFDSQFRGVVSNDGTMYNGFWHNYAKGADYTIPFEAVYGETRRFCSDAMNQAIALPTTLEVHFSQGDSTKHYPALGLFKQDPKTLKVTGTFATETGDYRFLEGSFCDSILKLSCFDGSHAFLFTASYKGDSLQGIFWSGTHHDEPWFALSNPEFALRDPDALTYVVDSSLVWETKFMDQEGGEHFLSSIGLENKVVILQALGSWCPNCIDETREFISFYNKYHERGLEIVPIAFEKGDTPEARAAVMLEFTKDLELPYPLYYGGAPSKKVAESVFPSLNHIISFPTSVVIGRDGRVRQVHTGFYGPGTHAHYDMWKHDMEILLDELIAAK